MQEIVMVTIGKLALILAVTVFFCCLIAKKPKGARKPKFAVGEIVGVKTGDSNRVSKMRVKRHVWDWYFEDSPYPFYRLSPIHGEPVYIQPKLGCICEQPEKYLDIV